MSNYRDDSTDLAVASDSTWLGLSAITESAARIAAVLLVAIGVLHTDGAAAAEEVIDRRTYTIEDVAQATDEAPGRMRAAVLLADSARVTDGLSGVRALLHEDSAQAVEQVSHTIGAVLEDGASAAEAIQDARTSRVTTEDAVRVSDDAVYRARESVADTATADDHAQDRLAGRSLTSDAAMIADSVEDDRGAAVALAIDGARGSSMVFDRLRAADLVADLALADALIVGEVGAGQAWAAGVDGWAMTRYAPYAFQQLAVIDGIAYGVTEAGVFALDGGAGEIEAIITTGKLDIGRGVLAHPIALYAQGEIDGTAEVTVTTTQRGTTEQYDYPLQMRPGPGMTAGRAVFGRGLRGARFAFELRMSGERGLFNDLRIEAMPTKRRM
ncbi:hypothetical protein [Thauera sp.]|uniref:hypothetical protein n=1 Tax=Thauera sp. TaxID=1905334 RepID=UPI00260A6618|nr:hypothetical protein [Thauera sp.]